MRLLPRSGSTPQLINLLMTLTFTAFVNPILLSSKHKQTEWKLTLGQLITMATHLMKVSTFITSWNKVIYLPFHNVWS